MIPGRTVPLDFVTGIVLITLLFSLSTPVRQKRCCVTRRLLCQSNSDPSDASVFDRLFCTRLVIRHIRSMDRCKADSCGIWIIYIRLNVFNQSPSRISSENPPGISLIEILRRCWSLFYCANRFGGVRLLGPPFPSNRTPRFGILGSVRFRYRSR